jgi:hypothetical protein
MRCTPFLIGDVAYTIHTYLQNNWRIRNPMDVDKIGYDPNMNLGKVVRENAFGSLKNRWKILKHFNYRVDRASPIIIVCCVFHNYCEIDLISKMRIPCLNYDRFYVTKGSNISTLQASIKDNSLLLGLLPWNDTKVLPRIVEKPDNYNQIQRMRELQLD